MLNIKNYFFFNKFNKNFLIFLPMLFSYNITYENIFKCSIGFLIFSSIVNICYLTNNYLDVKIDNFNQLKKNTQILQKKNIILLNILVIFFIAVLSFTNYFSPYLYLYLVVFYIYTFLIKKIFIADIVFLSLFYILRIFYGSDLINQNISVGFIFFFVLIFLILAIFKRVIQINVNNLKDKNSIISYSTKNLNLLKNCSDILIIISTLFLIYFIFLQNFFLINLFDFIFPGSLIQGLIIFSLFIINFLRIRYLIFSNKIKKDIVDFVSADFYSLFSSFILGITLVLIYI
jgi:4-hydroxybenzoate polyprenyltransferase